MPASWCWRVMRPTPEALPATGRDYGLIDHSTLWTDDYSNILGIMLRKKFGW